MTAPAPSPQDSEGCSYAVRSYRKRGAVNFMEAWGDITDSNAAFSVSQLDSAGKKRFREAVGHRPYRAVFGRASLAWKDRDGCRAYEQREGRWAQALRYATDMSRNGGSGWPPPICIHPDFTGKKQGVLALIDGARRLIACLECGIQNIEMVVIMPDVLRERRRAET